MFRLKSSLAILLSALLAACGGGSGPVVPDTGTDGNGNGGSSQLSNVTYFPLNFYLKGEKYLEGEMFSGMMFNPYIKSYVISPVHARTLEPVVPSLSDFNITVKTGAEPALINTFEQYATLQPIVGLPVNLNTAIIIDAGGTAQAQAYKTNMLQSVQNYINAVQASNDSVIRDQQFTIWVYGDSVVPVQPTLTNDPVLLQAALDTIDSNWATWGQGSALYRAVVSAIGSYKGKSPGGSFEEFDMTIDANDDLLDRFSFSAQNNNLLSLDLSNIIVIGSGARPSSNLFDFTSAQDALNWQSLVIYDTTAAAEENTDADNITDSEVLYLGKPLFYVNVGNSQVASEVSNLASSVISGNSFNYSSALISAQQSSVALRTRNNNQYLIRFAVRERDGVVELKLSSRARGYNFGLLTELNIDKLVELNNDDPVLFPIPDQADPRVEITTSNNGFLAGNRVRLADATRLYPATRYTVFSYTGSAYSWTVGGNPRIPNADGSVTISGADAGQTVVLTNNSLSSGVTSASLLITN